MKIISGRNKFQEKIKDGNEVSEGAYYFVGNPLCRNSSLKKKCLN